MGGGLGGTAGETAKVRLPSGIVRRIKPRLLSSQARLSEDFARFVEGLVQRLEPGARQIRIKVWLHDGSVVKVAHRVIGSFRATPKRGLNESSAPLPPEILASLSSAGASPERIVATLWLRLTRLLQHAAVRYGKIAVDIVDGKITSIRWTRTYRPGLDAPHVLEGLFAGAPEASWAGKQRDL